MIRNFLLAIAILTLGFSGLSQSNTGAITGTVKDKDGKPVEFAAVQVKDLQPGTFTDENGRFTIRAVPAGKHEVIVSVIGAEPMQQEVVVEAGASSPLTFNVAQRVHSLKEVNITSTGIRGEIMDIPGTVSVLDAKQIRESGAQNIGQIINRVPGVNYLDEDGRGLKPNVGLRGLDPLRNRNLLVLIDGKFPIGMTYYGDPASYYMTPVQNVERIEVIRGASPVLYGGYSVGGVVNMITKKGRYAPETKADFSYGSFSAFNAQLSRGGNTGKTSFLVSGLYRSGDSYRQRGRFEVKDFTINLGTRLDSTSEVSLYMNGFSENSETPGGLTQEQYDTDPSQSQHPADYFRSIRYSTAVSCRKTFGKHQSLSSSVYGNYFVRDWWIAYRNPTSNGYLRDIHAAGNVTDYNLTKDVLGRKNSLIAGIRVHSDRLDDINVAGNSNIARTGKTTGNSINNSFIYEGYLYDEFGVTRNLTVAPGIRYTSVEYTKNNFITQRKDRVTAEAVVYSGGVIYKLPARSRIYATVSKGFQPPTLNAALSPANVDAGVDLQPETSMNYEAGFRTSPAGWISLNASVYKMDFSSKVILENGIYRNAGSSFHRGVEAELELGSWKGLSFFANGTLQKATFTSGEDDGKLLPNAPQQMAATGLRYRAPFEKHGLVVNVFSNYVGKQYSDSKNTEAGTDDGKNGAIPAYHVMNGTVQYSYGRWGLYLNVNNLLGEKYFTLRWATWNGIIPAPGRNFLVGAQVRF